MWEEITAPVRIDKKVKAAVEKYLAPSNGSAAKFFSNAGKEKLALLKKRKKKK
jgi:hypothetical protein